MHRFLTIAAATGIAFVVYFLCTSEQDKFDVSIEGGLPKTMQSAAQTDEAAYTNEFVTGQSGAPSRDASPNDSPTAVSWRHRPASALHWEDWTNVALSMGGPVDGLIHNNLLASMDSSDYLQLISDMWDSGDPMALHSLAAIHKRASWKEHEPSAQIRGYAHDLAIVTLMTDYREEFDITVDRDSLSFWEAGLSEQRSQMHAHDIREAERLAREIIERNENCCVAWPDYFIDDQW